MESQDTWSLESESVLRVKEDTPVWETGREIVPGLGLPTLNSPIFTSTYSVKIASNFISSSATRPSSEVKRFPSTLWASTSYTCSETSGSTAFFQNRELIPDFESIDGPIPYDEILVNLRAIEAMFLNQRKCGFCIILCISFSCLMRCRGLIFCFHLASGSSAPASLGGFDSLTSSDTSFSSDLEFDDFFDGPDNALPFAPEWGTGGEEVPHIGFLTLGRSIATGPQSRIFRVLERDDLLIKYQMGTRSTRMHPLVNDYRFLRKAHSIGISPNAFFVSPGSKLPLQPDRKTAFDLNPANRASLIATRSTDVRYMVMEREGKSLEEVLAEHKALELKQAIVLGMHLFHSLEKLHGIGIIHGDLHLGNVCLSASNGQSLKLIDFGYSISATEEAEMVVRDSLTVVHPQLTPWELRGLKSARRDDIYKAFQIMAELAIGKDRLWSKEPGAPFHKVDPQTFYDFKLKGDYFSGESLPFDPVGDSIHLTTNQKSDAKSRLAAIARNITALDSTTRGIAYAEITAHLRAIYEMF